MLTKRTKLSHGISELGNLQVYKTIGIVEEGKLISSTRGAAYTPVDVNNMEGFDDRSKDIVAAITDEKVLAEFKTEYQEPTGIGIEKIVTTDRVVEEDGKIAVRRITRIFDDGIEVSKKYHRSWIMPGDDLSKADVISRAVAKKLHVPEVVMVYKAKLAE